MPPILLTFSLFKLTYLSDQVCSFINLIKLAYICLQQKQALKELQRVQAVQHQGPRARQEHPDLPTVQKHHVQQEPVPPAHQHHHEHQQEHPEGKAPHPVKATLTGVQICGIHRRITMYTPMAIAAVMPAEITIHMTMIVAG